MKTEFEIPLATPSNNVIKGMNRFAYKKLREDFALLVKAALRSKPYMTYHKCTIHIDRHGSRFLDWDNCYGGIKPLMDCLVRPTKSSPNGMWVIEDDNPKCVVGLTMDQVKSKRNAEKTVVTITG